MTAISIPRCFRPRSPPDNIGRSAGGPGIDRWAV
jgi:hypothetical protein